MHSWGEGERRTSLVATCALKAWSSLYICIYASPRDLISPGNPSFGVDQDHRAGEARRGTEGEFWIGGRGGRRGGADL